MDKDAIILQWIGCVLVILLGFGKVALFPFMISIETINGVMAGVFGG